LEYPPGNTALPFCEISAPMPELPEVETVRRGLQPVLEGSRILKVEQNRADLRFPLPMDFRTRLEGAKILSVGRRAKYLLVHADNGTVLIAHLGMSGSFRIESETGDGKTPGLFHRARTRQAAHDHVVFHLVTAGNSPVRIIYNDPRRFGFMLFCPEAGLADHPMLARLGVEPNGNLFNGVTLCGLLRGRNTPLKAALLDQSLVAGLGNIYVCEALWRAGLSPRRPAGSIVPKTAKTGAKADRLALAIRNVINEAIAAGGSSLRDHRQTDGSLGYFQHNFAVYDREGAACGKPGCHGTIMRFEQGGRSTFHCPKCQR
jgi:formamidopyrimidine-DNA glycosylase